MCLSDNLIAKQFTIKYNKLSFFKRFYLFIFREMGREGERGGEKHQ